MHQQVVGPTEPIERGSLGEQLKIPLHQGPSGHTQMDAGLFNGNMNGVSLAGRANSCRAAPGQPWCFGEGRGGQRHPLGKNSCRMSCCSQACAGHTVVVNSSGAQLCSVLAALPPAAPAGARWDGTGWDHVLGCCTPEGQQPGSCIAKGSSCSSLA